MGGCPRGTRQSYSQTAKTAVNKKVSNYSEDGEIQKTKKRVFISFHIDDEYAKQLLTHQAKSNKYDLDFINYAVNEPFDEKWKTQCRERIAMTSTVIVLIGPETYNREAVNWEINEAYSQDKKVIGVRVHRYKNHRIPQQMTENGAKIINWDINRISRELNED